MYSAIESLPTWIAGILFGYARKCSLRSNNTGCHSRKTTPQLRSLLQRPDSLSFDFCFSHDIWTRSSTASILTGQAPIDHQTWADDAKLPDEIKTIPNIFPLWDTKQSESHLIRKSHLQQDLTEVSMISIILLVKHCWMNSAQ